MTIYIVIAVQAPSYAQAVMDCEIRNAQAVNDDTLLSISPIGAFVNEAGEIEFSNHMIKVMGADEAWLMQQSWYSDLDQYFTQNEQAERLVFYDANQPEIEVP